MRWFIALIIIATAITTPVLLLKGKAAKPASIKAAANAASSNKAIFARLKDHSQDARVFTIKNGYNNHYCFLIDMKITSGKKRFFVYDLKADSVVASGMVTHGAACPSAEITFSNVPGSNLTSPGRYKIGNSYSGSFGLAYKLFGLDKTNSNAYNRFVVLHAHPCVPDTEVAPQRICTSWGCPTVSPAYLQLLAKYINQSSNPVLLWIYN